MNGFLDFFHDRQAAGFSTEDALARPCAAERVRRVALMRQNV
jgi:hypothetical protein